MPNYSAVKVTLAAALLISGAASPALAGSSTRSFQSLPTAKIGSAFSAGITSPFAVTRVTSQSSSRFAAPSLPSLPVSAPVAPQASALAQTNFGFGSGFGGGGLSFIFNFLPPQVRTAISNALAQSGPQGQQLCRLLGLPECGPSTSFG